LKHSYTKEQLSAAVSSSFSVREALERLGVSNQGGMYKIIYQAVERYGLDTSHFGTKNRQRRTNREYRQTPIEQLLVENSTTQSNVLRRRLIKEGIFSPVCSSCNLDQWLSQPISLELEHKNGINTDNRIENLCLLCPNCHAQTPTYRGRNKKKK